MSQEQFVNAVVQDCPEARRLVEARIREWDGEIVLHVIVADRRRQALAMIEEPPASISKPTLNRSNTSSDQRVPEPCVACSNHAEGAICVGGLPQFADTDTQRQLIERLLLNELTLMLQTPEVRV
jgi:hypothetical protein